jgi:hypothetical protein
MVGVEGVLVAVSNADDTGVVSWEWELLDSPLNSALVPGVLGTAATTSFTPDNPATPGCYRIKLTVQGADGSVACDVKNFAVPTSQGWILPPFKATAAELNFPGNEEGWESLLNEIFLSISVGGSDEKVKVSPADTTSGLIDSKVSPGAGLTRTIVNPGASEQYELDVVGNVDGSIAVNADDIQVGVLASDAQHGARGGGTQHADVTALVSGFMSAADKTKLDSLSSGGAAQLLFGDDSISNTTTVRYLTPGFDDGVAETSVTEIRLSRAGTLQSMRVRHNTAGTGAATLTYTLLIDGVATALAVAMSNTAQDGSNLVNSVAVTAGQRATIQVEKSGAITTSPDNVTCTVEFV